MEDITDQSSADPKVRAIESLVAQAERWRIDHKQAGRKVEAAACAIRTRALRDAIAALEAELAKEIEAGKKAYALGYREGLEKAAEVAEYRDPTNPFAPRDYKAQLIADAIRALIPSPQSNEQPPHVPDDT